MRPFQLQHSMLIHGAQLRNHMIQTEGEKQALHVLNPTVQVSTSLTKSQAAKWVFNRVETNRAKQRKLKHPMTANVWLLLELPSSAHIQKEKMLCATHSAMETPRMLIWSSLRTGLTDTPRAASRRLCLHSHRNYALSYLQKSRLCQAE